jgi:hypothetical protein
MAPPEEVVSDMQLGWSSDLDSHSSPEWTLTFCLWIPAEAEAAARTRV